MLDQDLIILSDKIKVGVRVEDGDVSGYCTIVGATERYLLLRRSVFRRSTLNVSH
jgi:hypothetical protein